VSSSCQQHHAAGHQQGGYPAPMIHMFVQENLRGHCIGHEGEGSGRRCYPGSSPQDKANSRLKNETAIMRMPSTKLGRRRIRPATGASRRSATGPYVTHFLQSPRTATRLLQLEASTTARMAPKCKRASWFSPVPQARAPDPAGCARWMRVKADLG